MLFPCNEDRFHIGASKSCHTSPNTEPGASVTAVLPYSRRMSGVTDVPRETLQWEGAINPSPAQLTAFWLGRAGKSYALVRSERRAAWRECLGRCYGMRTKNWGKRELLGAPTSVPSWLLAEPQLCKRNKPRRLFVLQRGCSGVSSTGQETPWR